MRKCQYPIIIIIIFEYLYGKTSINAIFQYSIELSHKPTFFIPNTYINLLYATNIALFLK